MKKISDYRIVYMGTPKMSADILEFMFLDGFNIVAVIAQEDQEVGRKRILEEVPTKVVAKKYGIPVFQPHKIRLDYEFVKDLKPDLILTMAYGQIVPQGLLDIPSKGALNLHGSILPKYRGAAPIQRAIFDGETKTGVTLMEMIDKMDAGKIYAIEECEISESDNYTSLCEKIVACSIKLVREKLPLYLEDKLSGREQNESLVTIAKKIKPEDEKLDLSKDTRMFLAHMRALSEVPGGYLFLDDKKFKIYKAHRISDNKKSTVGTLTVLKTPILQLMDGEIELDEVQLEGKKKMDGRSFANGSHSLNEKVLK